MARDDRTVHGDRGLRDEANVGPDPRAARQLTPMGELKHFKVAEGEPDIRGWRVFTSSGRELGRVEDLLVDTEAGEVVMLDVDLRRDDRHTLAPIRAAWIDREHERVIIDSRELESDEGLPSLARRGALSDAEVRQFGDRYDRAYGDRAHEGERDYRVRHETDDLRFGRRHSDVVSDAERQRAAAASAAAAVPPAPVAADRATDRAADRAVEREVARERASEEARQVNATLGAADAASDRRVPLVVERQPRAAVEREVVTSDLPADRQVRYPSTLAAPADASAAPPSGRVIEEVVVRRREVGPDEEIGPGT